MSIRNILQDNIQLCAAQFSIGADWRRVRMSIRGIRNEARAHIVPEDAKKEPMIKPHWSSWPFKARDRLSSARRKWKHVRARERAREERIIWGITGGDFNPRSDAPSFGVRSSCRQSPRGLSRWDARLNTVAKIEKNRRGGRESARHDALRRRRWLILAFNGRRDERRGRMTLHKIDWREK